MQLLNLLTFLTLSSTGIPGSPILVTAEEPIRISQVACHCDDSGRFVVSAKTNSYGKFTASWDYQGNQESQLSYTALYPEAVPARAAQVQFDVGCPNNREIWIKLQACQWIPSNSETNPPEGLSESSNQWFETHDCATETVNTFVRDGVCSAERSSN